LGGRLLRAGGGAQNEQEHRRLPVVHARPPANEARRSRRRGRVSGFVLGWESSSRLPLVLELFLRSRGARGRFTALRRAAAEHLAEKVAAGAAIGAGATSTSDVAERGSAAGEDLAQLAIRNASAHAHEHRGYSGEGRRGERLLILNLIIIINTMPVDGWQAGRRCGKLTGVRRWRSIRA
ncbi:MAG TPA: hypothetical protein VM691_10150, partial [Myxococcales bacterium]|nr:hypothetical protein [Myxococcales bacterium]